MSLPLDHPHIKHVSDRMAEHYIQLSHFDLEDVLQHVWVGRPGTPSPSTQLSGPATPLTREQAQALAIDLSRRSTPAEGGFCTFQPVVASGACPWNLDCHNCGKFVLSGADLLYWRRKREQWYSIAERAPEDATAAWLHKVFAPTAAALDGLEAALAGLGPGTRRLSGPHHGRPSLPRPAGAEPWPGDPGRLTAGSARKVSISSPRPSPGSSARPVNSSTAPAAVSPAGWVAWNSR
jgi:hypothetical protein